MTHTEKVHVLFGLMGAVTGALALWHAYHPASRARYAWPLLAFAIGFLLFVPVEAQTRTYKEVGWWDTLMSWIPDSPRYWWSRWFATLDQWHVIQHKMGALLIMAVAAVEWLRARGRLADPRWERLLPALLVGIGVAFGVHGGNAEHLPYHVEQVHHRIFGAGFLAGGMTLAMRQAGWLPGRWWHGLWAGLVLVVGLDIALLYRLDPSVRGMEVPHHGTHAAERLGP